MELARAPLQLLGALLGDQQLAHEELEHHQCDREEKSATTPALRYT